MHRSAAAGHGAAAAQKIFREYFIPSSEFSYDLFSHRKLQQNKYIATMASAASRQIIGGGKT